MSTYTLGNTSAEIDCTLSESYSRLTGNFAGPLNASIISNSGFLIQNGNKQTGLFVGNSCFVFGNNTLDFSKTCQNLILRLPESCKFLILGQSSGQSLNFNSSGTLSIGYELFSDSLGLQINNCSPSLILTDVNSAEQNQAISFINNSGNVFSKFFNNPFAPINSTLVAATQISYNKTLIFNEFGCSAKTFLSGNYLSFGFDLCLNTGYNFSVNGSSYFSSCLFTPTLIANTGYFCGNDLFLKGSGDSSSINVCNQVNSGLGVINFYNSSGAIYNKITSDQDVENGGSELNFYTTSTGAYSSLNRSELTLKLCGNKSANFYGDIFGNSALLNSCLIANEISNSGSKTFLNTGANGSHCFLLNNSGNIYSYVGSNNYITNHIWYVSGNNIAMCLDHSGNASITGSIFSHSGICSTGSLCINNQNLDSCIRSRCVVLSGNSNSCNILLYGNICSSGSFENNSTGSARFTAICATGNVESVISGLFRTCSNVCSSGSICSLGCVQTSSCGVFNQGVCSNSFISAQSCGVFGSVICVSGTSLKSCFCNSVDVCGSVNANNTAKAWGIYGLNSTFTPTLTGLNIKSINIYQNATPLVYAYGICFNTPITYPFVINFNVYSSGNALITGNNSNIQNGQSLGFSGVTSTNTHLGSASATVDYPFSVQFYALSGKRSSDNTLAAYSAGTSYSEIYFNLANRNGPTTNYSELTKANAHGIIHFSIFGQ